MTDNLDFGLLVAKSYDDQQAAWRKLMAERDAAKAIADECRKDAIAAIQDAAKLRNELALQTARAEAAERERDQLAVAR
jgi:hypothetical protein